MNNLAQIDIGPPGGFRGKGPLGLEGVLELFTGSTALLTFNRVIASTVGIITIIAIIWFIIQFFIGAIGILTSGGDKTKLGEAKAKITTGLIGLVIIIAGVFIIDLIGSLIGLDILQGAFLLLDIVPE